MTRSIRIAAIGLAAALGGGCTAKTSAPETRLKGDYDYCVMLGAAPNGGFEARRRMGFGHFESASADGAWLKRRSGASLAAITKVALTGDAVVLSLGDAGEIRGTVDSASISGQLHRGGKPINRVWLVKRTSPVVWEPDYQLWPGEVSQPTFQVTIEVNTMPLGELRRPPDGFYRPRIDLTGCESWIRDSSVMCKPKSEP